MDKSSFAEFFEMNGSSKADDPDYLKSIFMNCCKSSTEVIKCDIRRKRITLTIQQD